MADTTTTAETGTTTSPRTASTLPLNLEQDAEDKVPITPSDTQSEEGGNSASQGDDSFGPEVEGDDELGYFDSFNRGVEAHATFRQTANIAELNLAISYGRRALKLCQSGQPDHGACLHNIAVYLSDRFDKAGNASDLSEVIKHRRDALDFCPPGDPDRGERLNDLGKSLNDRFNKTGDLNDLSVAIQLGREALEQCPIDHPDRSMRLKNLAIYLSTLYHKKGDASDLTEIIQLRREVLDLSPPGDPDRGQHLNSLGMSLSDRFDKAGDMKDLSESIQLGREGLDLCPPDHPDRGWHLHNLTSKLIGRFNTTCDMHDLSESIQLGRKALDLCPSGHPDRNVRLNSLCNRLGDRFNKTHDIKDLAESIHLGREAVDLCPPGHPERGSCLYSLGISLNDRFVQAGDIEDLSESIQLGREALDLCPSGYPDRSLYVDNLGNRLGDRFRKAGDINDLSEAIQLGREALELCPPGHPARSRRLTNLSMSETDWVSHSNLNDRQVHGYKGPLGPGPCGSAMDETEVIEEAMNMLREATLPSPSPIAYRLEAASAWRSYSKRFTHKSQLEAMQETLNVLDESMGHSRSVESLHHRVSDFQAQKASTVASDAAALALEMGDVKLAASFLERGRSLIFTQLGRFRQFDLVQDAPSELVQQFAELSAALDDLVVHGPNAKAMRNSAEAVFNDLGILYQRIHAQWTNFVDKIRQVAGFESFLRPPSFEQLQQAALRGPVILINQTKDHSDAIIVLLTGDPVVVRLPEATPEAIHALADRFGARPAECHRDDAISILREVWRIIVSPVVTVLLDPRVRLRPGSRIWWCPTGAASRLPLHAAGPYARGERNLINYFISSYTPTLGALIRARKAKTVPLMDDKPVQEILVVGQPDTPNERYLPKVIDEVQTIKQRAPRATFLESSQGTKAAVLAGLREHKWIHLACHGHHNPSEPFKSHFSMFDGPITLLDLIEKDLPHAELAVLSACHSARVSEQLPDEVLHPAAGMLFAGYKSVIGTMWALDDGIGSALADQFYRLMLGGKNGPRPYSDAAIVLAKAFGALDRAGYEIPFMQRINVVHYGV